MVFISKKNFFNFLFILILITGAILRLSFLDKSFESDEVLTVMGAESGFSEMVDFASTVDSHPPLGYMILHFWMFFNKSESWVRLLFVIFGIFTIAISYWIGRAYLNEDLALLTMFLTAISPLAIWISQYVRSYSIAVFFILLGVYFIIRISKSNGGNLFDWFAYILSSIICIYTFYFSILVIIAQNLFIISKNIKNYKIILKWIISQAIIFISFLPWLIFFLRQLKTISFNQFVSESFGYYLLRFHLGGLARSIIGTLGIDPLLLSEVPVAAHWNKTALFLISFLLVSCFIMIMVFAVKLFKKNNTSKLVSVWFFPFLVLIPLGLANFLHNWKGIFISPDYFFMITVFFYICLSASLLFFNNKKIIFLFLAIFSLFSFSRLKDIYPPQEEWRELAKYLAPKIENSDCVAFIRTGELPFDYYMHVKNDQIDLAEYLKRNDNSCIFSGINEEKTKKLRKILSKYGNIWLVVTHSGLFKGDNFIKEWLVSQGYKKEERIDYRGIQLLKYNIQGKRS